MIFKKGNIPNAKDVLADSYIQTLKENRERVREKTREIQKCIKDGLSCPIEKEAKLEEKSKDEETLL